MAADGIDYGLGPLFDGLKVHDSVGSGVDGKEYFSGRGKGGISPLFHGVKSDDSGSGSSGLDEEEDHPGTYDDMEQQPLFCRGVDGIHGDFVPLSDVGPEVMAEYVPKSVREAFDRYNDFVDRSEGFDCDRDLYYALPSYLRLPYYTQPVDISDPQHSDSLEQCAKFAIGNYNRREKANLALKGVLKATMVDHSGTLQDLMYFITLEAEDVSMEPPELKTYRARVTFKPYLRRGQYKLYSFEEMADGLVA